MSIIADPWFWILAIPAVLLSGISKAGFASGAGLVSAVDGLECLALGTRDC